jgi:hypothetical protein
MEAHGSSVDKLAHQLTSLLPDGLAEKLSPALSRCRSLGQRAARYAGAANDYANAKTTGKVKAVVLLSPGGGSQSVRY